MELLDKIIQSAIAGTKNPLLGGRGAVSGSEAVLDAMIHENVTTIFGYPGGAIMPIYDALYDYNDRLQHILVRHEQGAIHAAQGFARASGRTTYCSPAPQRGSPPAPQKGVLSACNCRLYYFIKKFHLLLF